MTTMPLRYRISDWHQLRKCASNNSSKLHIKVSDFIQNDVLEGTLISVYHDLYGTVFAYVVGARGRMITEPYPNKVYELTTAQILEELNKYGFVVEYAPREHLSIDQLDYLRTLSSLHFDKIRTMSVWNILPDGTKTTKQLVCAFVVDKNPNWLDNAYSPSESDFNESVADGSAMNLSLISKSQKYNWSWLDYVANISDILRDNKVGV